MPERYTPPPPGERRPRLSIDISEEQRQRLSRLIPWGMMGHLFRRVIDDVLDLVEEFGPAVLTAIVNDMIPDKTYLSITKEVKKDGHLRNPEEEHQ